MNKTKLKMKQKRQTFHPLTPNHHTSKSQPRSMEKSSPQRKLPCFSTLSKYTLKKKKKKSELKQKPSQRFSPSPTWCLKEHTNSYNHNIPPKPSQQHPQPPHTPPSKRGGEARREEKERRRRKNGGSYEGNGGTLSC